MGPHGWSDSTALARSWPGSSTAAWPRESRVRSLQSSARRGGGGRGGCVPDAMAGGHPIPSSRTPSQPGWPLPGEHALHECSVRSCSQGCWVRAMLQHSLMDMSRRSETCYYHHCTSLTLGKELAQEWSSGADKGSHEGVIWYASVQCGGIS